jgi:hypothetical protein
MKLSKEKRDRIILLAVVTLGLSWGLWHFVVSTRSTRLGAQQAELEKQQNLLAQARDWIERAQSVEKEMTESLARLAEVEDGLANRTDPYAWSYLLLDQIRQSHPTLVRLDVAGKPSIGPTRLLPNFPYDATTFTVVGRGYYHDFGKFLADFENDYPYFRVENIELTPQSSTTDPSLERVELEMLNLKFDVVALLKPPAK